jgi:hypothetical protein
MNPIHTLHLSLLSQNYVNHFTKCSYD